MIQLVLFICTAFAVEAEIGETDASKMAKMCATEAASTEYPILVRKLQRRLCGTSVDPEFGEMDASKRAKMCATDVSGAEYPDVVRKAHRRLCGTFKTEIGEMVASKRAKLCATDATGAEYPDVVRKLQRRLCGTSINAEIGEVDASKRAKMCATDVASSEYPEVLRELQRRLCGTSIEAEIAEDQNSILAKENAMLMEKIHAALGGEGPDPTMAPTEKVEAEIGELNASQTAKLCATDADSAKWPSLVLVMQRKLCELVSSDSAQSLIFELASTPNDTLVIALAVVGFAATLYVVKKVLCRQKYAQLDYATAEEI